MQPQTSDDRDGLRGDHCTSSGSITTARRSSRWPRRLAKLARKITAPGADQDVLSEALWRILTFSLMFNLRRHQSRYGFVPAEDIADIAAEKSLDLLRSIESSKWKPGECSEDEIRGYLSRVARNGLLGRLRQTRRYVTLEDEVANRVDARAGLSGPAQVTAESVVSWAGSREFAAAIERCVGKLAPRARIAWMLRVFAEMPTKEIAVHPQIDCRPGNVDVILQRTRRALTDCLARQGFTARDLGPGTFVALWRNLYYKSGEE